MDANVFALIQRALAEPKRVEILELIRKMQGDSGVTCSLVLGATSVSQSTFSHHIGELANAGLISGEKEGRFSRLTVNEPIIEAYLEEFRKKLLG